MKIDGVKITGLTTHALHDGELVVVTVEGASVGVIGTLQTTDKAIGAEWKREYEAARAAAEMKVGGTAPVVTTKKVVAASAGKSEAK